MIDIIKYIFDIYKNDNTINKHGWEDMLFYLNIPDQYTNTVIDLCSKNNIKYDVLLNINNIEAYIKKIIIDNHYKYINNIETVIKNICVNYTKSLFDKLKLVNYENDGLYIDLTLNRVKYMLQYYIQNNEIVDTLDFSKNNPNDYVMPFNTSIISELNTYYTSYINIFNKVTDENYGLPDGNNRITTFCHYTRNYFSHKNNKNNALDKPNYLNKFDYDYWTNVSKCNINFSLFTYYLENVYNNHNINNNNYNNNNNGYDMSCPHNNRQLQHNNVCRCFDILSITSDAYKNFDYKRSKIIYNFLNNKNIIRMLLLNKDIKLIDIINKYDYIEWNFNELSRHPCITWDNIIENPEYSWSYDDLCYNINMTLDNINLFIKINNINITKDNNPRTLFAKNINLLPKEIDDILNKESGQLYKKYFFFNDDPISLNPNLTLGIIKKYGNHIADNYNLIIKNKFSYDEIFDKEYYKIIQTINKLKLYHQELIEKVCTPKRKINWDEDFMEDCKSGFYGDEGFKIYNDECNKY